jgi:predicted TIM-barrel fold metal-dependent hydrolase
LTTALPVNDAASLTIAISATILRFQNSRSIKRDGLRPVRREEHAMTETVVEQLDAVISGDTHLEIDSTAWIERIPARHRDRAPRVVRTPEGADAWVVEGAPLQDMVFSLYAGKGRDTWAPFKQRYEDSAGTGPPKQRLAEQDVDGISAEVLFPGANGPRFWRHVRDDDCYLAFIRAYNEFLAEEYCAADPARLLGVGVIPWTNVDDAIAELQYCHANGLRAVQLGVFPNGTGAPSTDDDAFWEAALGLGVVVTVHVDLDRSRGGELTKMIDMKDTSERARRKIPGEALMAQQCSVFGRAGAPNAMQLALSGVFDRFPNLRIFFAENQIGWIPFWLEQADVRFHRHRHWVARELGWRPVERLPSEYVRDHCYWGFQQDRVGVTLRDLIGVDKLIWATDFPHQESDWPESRSILELNFAGVPIEETRMMTSGNVSRLFGLA